MSDTPARPQHTNVAAAIVIGASVGVVASVAEQLAGLHSLETREQLSAFLAQPLGEALGIDVSTAVELLRVVLMLLAGCATAAAVLGFHAMKGSTRARLGLTVLALPIFLGGFATGGFLTSLVVAGTALLWVGPSALWFRGEPIPDRPPRAEIRPLPSRQAAPPPPVSSPTAPERAAPPQPAVQRPEAVVWACVLTWAFSSLTIVGMVVSAVLMASSPDLVFDELARQNADLAGDSARLVEATYATTAIAGVWSLLAIGLGVLAYRRVRWGRVALMASAAVAAVVCLIATLSSLLLVVPACATLATVVLLNRPEVRTWFSRT